MNKILLIVDPQNDFITGSLPVPSAAAAMDSLAEYVKENAKEYSAVIVTEDWHPANHNSFKRNGGEWPDHCVAETDGAMVWEPLMSELMNSGQPIYVFHKGEDSGKEEYSFLQSPGTPEKVAELLDKYKIEQFDVCGLAGDICVTTTIRDAVVRFGKKIKINVLEEFSPSLDGGKTLKELVKNLKNPV